MNIRSLVTCGVVVAACVARADLSAVPSGYVTDNLVAVWDCSSGLDANGWTTCYSADGQNHTFVWTGEEKDTITFDSTNGVRFTGSASAYGALPSTDCTTTFKAAENGTMEIVFLREETQYGSCVLQVPNNDGRQGLIFYKDFYNNRYFTCNPDGNQRPTYVFSENDCLVRSLAVHYTDGLASENSVTLNGESVPKYGADLFVTGNSDAFLGNNHALGSPFKGRILAIRLYSQKLSEAQVINNARLDMRRFGYKRDSLVAAWDYSEGLDATGWKSAFSADGVAHTFVWTGSNKGTIEADSAKGLRFTGVENAYGVLSPEDCDKTFNLARNGTMEIVVMHDSSAGSCCALQVSRGNGAQALIFDWSGGRFCCNGSSQSLSLYQITKDNHLRRTIAATYTDGVPDASGTFHNGVKGTAYETEVYDNSLTKGAYLGHRQNLKSNWAFKGRIFAIRLYKEKLDATQLAAHAEADRLCMPNLVTALSSDETRGAVSGETPALAGTPFTVTAEPAFGFRFLQWENVDGSFLSYEKTLTTSFPLHRQIVARFVDASDLDYNTANKSLVAMWDCSRGLDANGWTSCYSTNGTPYTFAWTGENKDAITFTATNGVRFTGVANAYGVLPPADCASTFNLARNGTMEIVLVREATSGDACALQVSRACGDQTLFFYTITAGHRFSCCNGIFGEKGQWYSMKEDSNLLRVFSATYTDGYTNNDKVFQNGEEATKTELDNFGVRELGAVLGSNQNNACPFKGRVLAIRLYSEKLSEEKIVQNYTNDTIRFTTCVQTIHTRVAEDSEGCGSVTAGGDYILGTSVTLTATPAPGYKFSHWAGDIDGLDVSSSTLTFAVDVSRDLEAVFTRRPGLILIFR